LRKVPQIEHFDVKHENGRKYKIIVATKHDVFALSEGLYENGLSLKIYGDLYKIIDVKEGG
jgi:alpha-L-fucosidase